MAVSANFDVLALPVGTVLSFILHARRVRDACVISVIVDTSWISTVASAASLARDHHLRVQVNRSRVQILEEDVESVSEGRSRSLSPA